MKAKNYIRLLRFEIKKNFINPWILIFLVILLCANGWRLYTEYKEDTKRTDGIEELYETFYERYKGNITPEKVEDLMSVYGHLKEKEENMSLSNAPGTGTYLESEYEDWRFFHFQFAEEMEYDYLYVNRATGITNQAIELYQVYEQAGNKYEAAKNQVIANTFYGRQISDFADTRYIETWLDHDYSSMMIALLCLFGLCSVFVSEKETEMYMLQRTSKLGGGATVAAKMTASAMFVLLICILFYAQDYLVLQLLSGHSEALGSPIYAIPAFRSTGLNMTVGQFIWWYSAVKSFGILIISCTILLLSCLCRRILTTFVTGFGAIAGFALLQELSLLRPLLKWFNPMEAIIIRETVYNITFVNVFGFSIRLEHFIIFGLLVVTVLLVFAILRRNPGRVERRG